MNKTIGIVILAAGKGTRMKSELPKALVPSLGKPLIQYVLESSRSFCEKANLNFATSIVVGHRKELIENWLETYSYKDQIKLAWQKEQKGTADALKACFQELPEFWQNDYTIVACADTPLITDYEFQQLFNQLTSDSNLEGVAATFDLENPFGYGRIVRREQGFHIIEEKDASDDQKRITEVNSGFYIIKTSHLKRTLGEISNNNKAGEFYLTDLFQDHFFVKPVKFSSHEAFLGINTFEQLNKVNMIIQNRIFLKLLNSGVMILNPSCTYIEETVQISSGTIIYPGTTILGNTIIHEDVLVEPGCVIRSSFINKGASILANSYLESAVVRSGASIGPMARLRPGSDIGKEAKVGNFVEIKKSKLGDGAKVSHLSYVGDAEIGDQTNIGCGFITCNYDGINKHKTNIGSHSFIGSDCQMVAPISIGNNVFVAAGSTITKNIPDDGFAIARSTQVTKEGMAKKFLKSKKK
jgi:bifunctional UDP-N-acetylglucosamine pyrophosphorylase/glucosamine-1-phosphate N-acetyltransferase